MARDDLNAVSFLNQLSTNAITEGIEQHDIEEPTIDNPAPTPERILVRQIDLDTTAPTGPLLFFRPDRAWAFSPGRLDTILDQLRAGTYTPNAPVNAINRPLDVNCGRATQFIFCLRNRQGLNWRFSAKAKGVTLGVVDANERRNYYSLRHVLDDSVGRPHPFAHPAMCRIVTFLADKTSDDFQHPFNLNIEFVYPDDGRPNTLPVVLDPDIRHPGGSGEE